MKVVENERVYLLSNGSLYISEVESRRGDKSDEGLYQCLAQNKYGAILSQKARLTIASKYWKCDSMIRYYADDGQLFPVTYDNCWVRFKSSCLIRLF